MSVEPLRPALSRRDALFADPLLRRDLLLIALVWDHLIDTKPLDTTAKSLSLKLVARMAGLPYREVVRLLIEDVPRYEPPEEPEHCQYTGPRGGRCARRQWGVSHPLRDPGDGTITWVGSCYHPSHREWAQHQAVLHDEVLGARTPPKPAYNTRSRIAHHFEDDLDFPPWWVKLTTAKAERGGGMLRMGSASVHVPRQVDHEMIYDVSRDPDRGGRPLIQRPRLRLVI